MERSELSHLPAEVWHVAIGFCAALNSLDRASPWQILGWYAAMTSVQFELKNGGATLDPAEFEAACGLPAAAEWFAKTWLGRQMGIKSNHECRECRRHLEGEWSRAARDSVERAELQRQMDAGRCDRCVLSDAALDLADQAAAAAHREAQLQRVWRWAGEQDAAPGPTVVLSWPQLAELLRRET